MKLIKKDGCFFSVDTERTKEYYATHLLCDCVYCCNYYAQVKERFPKLSAFLDEFGIDASKPDEAWSMESDNSINYIQVDYTVCGKVDLTDKHKIEIHDGQLLSIIITDGFVSPNEQTGDYFTISVMDINLEWASENPKPIL